VAVVTLVVAKVDKGERVGQWKGPLIKVRWHVGGRRAARAAEARSVADRRSVLDVIVARQAACLSSAAIELVHTASFVPIFNSGLYGRACFYPATQKRKGALIFWWGPWTQIMVLHNHRWPKNRHRNKGGYHVCPLPT